MDVRRLSLRHRSLLDVLLNRAMDAAGLAEGTNAGTYKTVNAVAYSVKGKLYSKAATDNIAFAAATGADAFVTQPDLSTCYYLICLDASGNARVVQGRDSLKSRAQGKPAPGEIPNVPSNDYTVIGILKIVTSGGTFLPGTTDLSGAGVTDTWYDVAAVPGNAADL
jgi:hypothetical protein